MDDCIFCAIVAGKAEASMVYEDETVCSFLTIGPVNPGHLLVIPKRHQPLLSDLDEETGMHLFKVTMYMAKALRHSGLQCEGINLFLADGKAAFQEVFHVHMHVFPRFQGDPFKIDANWESKPSRQVLDEIAERIRRADQVLRQETHTERAPGTSG
jgi:diadenosine tetraphosphate (Ap4A) HIT family hydrolase